MPKIIFLQQLGFFLIVLFFPACSLTPAEISPTNTVIPPEYTSSLKWIPSTSDTYQIQLSDYPPDLSIAASVFELDLFETSAETINSLHKSGIKVICYLNVGAWEEFRPDAGNFPDSVLGKDYVGWKGERWLDISNYGLFSSIISARFDLASSKGCDGLDTDNIDGFQQDTGFTITAQDQLIYNIWLVEQAHLRGLAIGMKNNNDQVAELAKYFDFAVIEDCSLFDECEDYYHFIEQEKAVFQIEYTDGLISFEDFCGKSNVNGYFGIMKNRNLDAWAKLCNSS